MKEMSGPVRLALIGLGGMGKKHAAMIASGAIEGLELTAVCSRSQQARDYAKENLPGVEYFSTQEELYQRQDLFDAILIVTPHKLHPDMAKRAFAAGKHVLCEKPAGAHAKDAREMTGASGELVYGLLCQQRAYESHRRLKQLLTDGTLGELRRASLENTRYFRTRFYHHSGSWRSSWEGEGGGVLINQGYHLIDLWIWLFGLPSRVNAHICFGKYNDFSVDDEATLVMDYPNALTGTFFITTGEAAYTERLVISGTRGMAILEDGELTLTLYEEDSQAYALAASCTDASQLKMSQSHASFPDNKDAYRLCLQSFADAIRKGQSPLCPGQEGEKALSLIEASYLSAFKGQTLSLPLTPEQEEELAGYEKDQR